MKAIVFSVFLCSAPAAFAGNYATCVLDKAPGIANEPAAYAVAQLCRSDHPGGLEAVPQGSGRGLFGFKSGAECTAKKAGETRSNQAAYLIGAVCRRLYDEPVTFTFEEAQGLPKKP